MEVDLFDGRREATLVYRYNGSVDVDNRMCPCISVVLTLYCFMVKGDDLTEDFFGQMRLMRF